MTRVKIAEFTSGTGALNEPDSRWATALYWFCWLLLALLATVVVLGLR